MSKIVLEVNNEKIETTTSTIARNITSEDLANIIDDHLNGLYNQEAGMMVGVKLRNTHRTLQRLAVKFALDLLYGISQQDYTDARNQQAIETAKKIRQMVDNGELPIGYYI